MRAPEPTPKAVHAALTEKINSTQKSLDDLPAYKLKLENYKASLEEKLKCEHNWKYDRGSNIGGENTLDVYCTVCGYVWF